MKFRFFSLACFLWAGSALTHAAEPVKYGRVAPVFQKYCVGCHNPMDKEGGLVLSTYADFLKGGEHGKVLDLGQPEKSKLLTVTTGSTEPAMPPEGLERPTQQELELLKQWFKEGAKGPGDGESEASPLTTPKIPVVGEARPSIHALAISPDSKWIALGRHGVVEILRQADQKPVQKLTGPTGPVNDLAFSAEGNLLIAVAGEPGLFGEISIWDTKTWKRTATWRGHNDQLYALAIHPDGNTLATGGYDQQILLWDVKTRERLAELNGHNGPVFDLAFHPQKPILASASGDRTVKLWNTKTQKRLETFSEPEKEQYAVAFHPDGKTVVAGGVDNRIRVWNVSPTARAGTNQLKYTRFAHEAAILRLVFSPQGNRLISSGEDQTLKVWETDTFTQQRTIAGQPDWPVAVAINGKNDVGFVGRLDGSFSRFPLKAKTPHQTTQPLLTNEDSTSAGQSMPTIAEKPGAEPNDSPENPGVLRLPGQISGRLFSSDGFEDQDYFRFHANQGETWIFETHAASRKSPADTKLEILTPNGDPVERLLLQAVRDSYITFRPIDSRQNQVRVKNWEEMKLNQYMYLGGEVTRLYRMPQGPDSGFLFYKSAGKRRLYFDTSATIHALGDPVYIVEPFPTGSLLIDNGLPVFPVYYANDDDAERKKGADSRLTFTAPNTGDYLVRITDTRGLNGPNHFYTLEARKPVPDFRVTIAGKNAKIPRGSGQRVRFSLNRIDNFSGPVRVTVENLPAGYHVSTPTVIQAGHLEAEAVLWADADAKTFPKDVWNKVKVTASATVGGRTITHRLGNLGMVELMPAPKVRVILATDPSNPSADPGEIVLAPGTTTTAMLSIERNGFNGELKFDVDNLPHGVIVDNIGLSGVLIRQGESKRQIFLTAADWVPETTRLIHAVAKGAGNQASQPLSIRIQKPLAQTRN